MITVRFFSDGDLLCGFDVRGHAGLAESGQDVLCAAVSSAAYMTANTLTEILKIPCTAKDGDGVMTVSLPAQYASAAQPLLQGFQLHLRELSRQYPKYLKVHYGGKDNA